MDENRNDKNERERTQHEAIVTFSKEKGAVWGNQEISIVV